MVFIHWQLNLWQSPKGKRWLTHWASLLRWRWSYPQLTATELFDPRSQNLVQTYIVVIRPMHHTCGKLHWPLSTFACKCDRYIVYFILDILFAMAFFISVLFISLVKAITKIWEVFTFWEVPIRGHVFTVYGLTIQHVSQLIMNFKCCGIAKNWNLYIPKT